MVDSMSADGAIPPTAELQRDFGLDSESFRRWLDGFASECWIVDDRWFVKVWGADDHPVDLGLLGRLADAGLPVPRPLRSDLLRTADGNRYAAFPYIQGRHATGSDWREVAGMLRRVHDTPADGLGLPTMPPTDEPLIHLRPRLDHPWIADRADELSVWPDRFETVLSQARATEVPHVLSHDRPGVSTWGFDRLARVDETLAMFL